jgi:hypothetical protein
MSVRRPHLAGGAEQACTTPKAGLDKRVHAIAVMNVQRENSLGAQFSLLGEDQRVGCTGKHAAADQDVVVEQAGRRRCYSNELPQDN